MSIKKTAETIIPARHVAANLLFKSDFFEIKNWAFDFSGASESSKGFNDCLCLVIVRKGNFLFDLSTASYDMHTGHAIIDKPNYEYRLRPASGKCSIFNFTNEFYLEFVDSMPLPQSAFFSNGRLLSLLLRTTPEIEFLHYQVLTRFADAGKLEMDTLVLELLRLVVCSIANVPTDDLPGKSLMRHHLGTVECAKEYMNQHFSSDLSLYEISRHCCVSPFHFSRIFRKFTFFSPYQYLLNIRLKHAEMQLRTSSATVADISFSSGFNSAEHFTTSFRQKYKMSPSRYRA